MEESKPILMRDRVEKKETEVSDPTLGDMSMGWKWEEELVK